MQPGRQTSTVIAQDQRLRRIAHVQTALPPSRMPGARSNPIGTASKPLLLAYSSTPTSPASLDLNRGRPSASTAVLQPLLAVLISVSRRRETSRTRIMRASAVSPTA